MYALGVVAYQCLSGRRPFEGDNPLEIAMKHVRDTPRPLPADCPPAVRSIVERSMAKDPAARYPTAAALASVARQTASALSNARKTGQPVSGSPGSPVSARSGPPYQAATGTARPPAPRPPAARPLAAAPTSAPQPTSVPPALGQQAGPARRPTTAPPAQTGYNRGAAAVPQPSYNAPRPPAAGAPRPPVGVPRPPAASNGATNRPLMITLAIVVGLLVVLCSGMISYWVNKYGATALGMRTVTAVASDLRQPEPRGVRVGSSAWAIDGPHGTAARGPSTDAGRDGPGHTPYRQVGQLVRQGDQTSEGRRTR
ncbi:hypothetical protein GCM10027605_73880 [Micromonospora zhanjiangensis]